MAFQNTPPASRPHIFGRELAPLSTAIVLTTALVAFEGLSVSAALPEIGADLGSVGLLPWTMTAYLLASGLALAIAGSLIDHVGARSVFRASTLGFVVSSGLCAAAGDLGLLVAGRIAQGLAGGAIIAASGSAVGLAYPQAIRSRVYALAATVWGVLAVAGPAIAAVLLGWLGWRSIFWVNVPLGLVAASLGWRPMPGPLGGRTRFRLDAYGALLVAGFTTAGLLAVAATASGRGPWRVAALAIAALVGAGLYWQHSGRAAAPILGRRYFAEAPFRDLALTAGLIMAAGMGVEAFLPLYLRGARDASTSLAAWSVLFLALGWTVSANIAGRLYHRLPESRIAQIAAVSMLPILALGLLAILTAAPLGLLFGLYFAAGLGIGAVTNASLTLVQQWADEHEIGRATAAHQFLRNLAITFGTAAAGAAIVAWAAAPVSEAGEATLSGDAGGLARLDPDGLTHGFAAAHVVALALTIGAVLAARGVVRRQAAGDTTPLGETRLPGATAS